jgi:hypothetical protein
MAATQASSAPRKSALLYFSMVVVVPRPPETAGPRYASNIRPPSRPRPL